MDLRLQDKTVVLTGGASGIGFATLKLLLDSGAFVVACDRKPLAEFKVTGKKLARLQYIEGNVLDSGTLEHCISALPRGQMDALILCAALGPLENDPVEIVRVNYSAKVNWILSFQGAFREWGGIVLMSSTAAYRLRWPARWKRLLDESFSKREANDLWSEISRMTGRQAYALAKWGVLEAHKRLSQELATRRIRVNCIAPGPTKTLMSRPLWEEDRRAWKQITEENPFRTFSTPEEIAALIALLISPLARTVHGTIIHADGGWYGKRCVE